MASCGASRPISALVAYDQHYGIGADNDLLWRRDLPADLQRFKTLTLGNSVIMGRKTFESIGRPLPGRQNIVVSSTLATIDGVTTVGSLPAAYAAATAAPYIIGGGSIYRAALPDITTIYATEVAAQFPAATVFFPKLDTTIWREASREHHTADERNAYAFDFVTYVRV